MKQSEEAAIPLKSIRGQFLGLFIRCCIISLQSPNSNNWLLLVSKPQSLIFRVSKPFSFAIYLNINLKGNKQIECKVKILKRKQRLRQSCSNVKDFEVINELFWKRRRHFKANLSILDISFDIVKRNTQDYLNIKVYSRKG